MFHNHLRFNIKAHYVIIIIIVSIVISLLKYLNIKCFDIYLYQLTNCDLYIIYSLVLLLCAAGMSKVIEYFVIDNITVIIMKVIRVHVSKVEEL